MPEKQAHKRTPSAVKPTACGKLTDPAVACEKGEKKEEQSELLIKMAHPEGDLPKASIQTLLDWNKTLESIGYKQTGKNSPDIASKSISPARQTMTRT